MSIFYFNLFTPTTSVPDKTGLVLHGTREAMVEAVRLVGALLGDERRRQTLGDHWYVEVTDWSGLCLFRLNCLSPGEPRLVPHARSARPYLH